MDFLSGHISHPFGAVAVKVFKYNNILLLATFLKIIRATGPGNQTPEPGPNDVDSRGGKRTDFSGTADFFSDNILKLYKKMKIIMGG
jgi:hypothetical protein